MNIKVLGKNIKVHSKDLTHEVACGYYEPGKNKITICSSLKGSEKIHTLLHEVFHAVIFRSSLYQVITPDIQEIVVDVFSTVLVENFDIKCKNDK